MDPASDCDLAGHVYEGRREFLALSDEESGRPCRAVRLRVCVTGLLSPMPASCGASGFFPGSRPPGCSGLAVLEA